MVNNKNISIAARALAIGMVAALVLVGTALGKYQEDSTSSEWLLLGILFFAIGVVLNYFGWKIYHLYIMIIGFILGSIIGAIVGINSFTFRYSPQPVLWDIVLIFCLFGGIVGAWLAPKIEKAIFLIGAFLIGLIPGFLISGSLGLLKIQYLREESPIGVILAILIAIAIAIIAWKIHKFFIIFALSCIGSLLMQIGYALASNSELYKTSPLLYSEFYKTFPILFLFFLVSGIWVQYTKRKQVEEKGEVPLLNVADLINDVRSAFSTREKRRLLLIQSIVAGSFSIILSVLIIYFSFQYTKFILERDFFTASIITPEIKPFILIRGLPFLTPEIISLLIGGYLSRRIGKKSTFNSAFLSGAMISIPYAIFVALPIFFFRGQIIFVVKSFAISLIFAIIFGGIGGTLGRISEKYTPKIASLKRLLDRKSN